MKKHCFLSEVMWAWEEKAGACLAKLKGGEDEVQTADGERDGELAKVCQSSLAEWCDPRS